MILYINRYWTNIIGLHNTENHEFLYCVAPLMSSLRHKDLCSCCCHCCRCIGRPYCCHQCRCNTHTAAEPATISYPRCSSEAANHHELQPLHRDTTSFSVPLKVLLDRDAISPPTRDIVHSRHDRCCQTMRRQGTRRTLLLHIDHHEHCKALHVTATRLEMKYGLKVVLELFRCHHFHNPIVVRWK